MKKLLILAIALAPAALLPLTANADDTPLTKEMEAVDEAFKSFRRETDPAKGAKSAREAQDAVLKAIPLVPALVEKLPAAEKEKAIASYRVQMGKLFVTFSEVEAAFIAKDLDAVAKLVEAVRGAKREGHDEFMEE